jgi:hypothetical protein
MYQSRIAKLCAAAASGSLISIPHYTQRLTTRATPNQEDIRFLLCEDAPEVIEDYPEDERGATCLIRGETDSGRVGHVVCSYPPDNRVITAYFPAETQPWKWDSGYRIRICKIMQEE